MDELKKQILNSSNPEQELKNIIEKMPPRHPKTDLFIRCIYNDSELLGLYLGVNKEK